MRGILVLLRRFDLAMELAAFMTSKGQPMTTFAPDQTIPGGDTDCPLIDRATALSDALIDLPLIDFNFSLTHWDMTCPP